MESIVSVKWLKENIDNPNLIILYSNLGSTQEAPVYIKNSRLFDIKNTFSNIESALPNTFPSTEQFQNNCQKIGINKNSIIVVYDDRKMFSAPRVWWMFRTMGHQNVAVLNGGINDWISDKNLTETKLKTIFETGDFKASLNTNAVKYLEEIQQNIVTEKMLVLDARAAGRFNGKIPESRKGLQSGHISKSINIPYTEVLNNGKFKTKTELEQLFKTVKVKQKPLTFTCGSGVTACIILLAAYQVLDNEMAVYDGSWTEWATVNKK